MEKSNNPQGDAGRYAEYRNDWRPFVHDILGQRSLWSAQEEIIDSVWRNRATAVRAGQGVGKTHAAAIAALSFLYVFEPAKVLITAPTWWQAKHVFWRALCKMHASAAQPLHGKLLGEKLILGEEWWAQARATRNANFFQGVHAANLLVIVDEAAGVSEGIFEGVRTLATGAANKLLLIGNPTARSGSFYSAFSDPAYNHICISCFDHPNVTEKCEKYPGAVTTQWIQERRAEWEGTPLWEARVLGEFPSQSENQLISGAWVAAARELGKTINREIKAPGPLTSLFGGAVGIGVDVARFGDDETVIYVMRDGAVVEQRTFRKRDLMETAGHVTTLAREHGATKIAVDDTGLGGGLTDRLRELGHDVMAINFGGRPADSKRYYDVPSELWGELADALRAEFIAIPPKDLLGEQLTARHYTYHNCSLKIESKDEMKRRGLKSPDRADALALAWRACSAAAGRYSPKSRGTVVCLGNLMPD